ncbi:MAG: integrase [Ruminococcaceae bacterium]|nr:integrase [Oscillospiraceae bacterium]
MMITKEKLEKFKNYLYEEEKSENTILKYLRDLNFFSKWLGEKEITKKEVLDFKKDLIEKYAPASVNSMLSSLNAFFEYNNWQNLKVKTLKIQKQIFSNKELTKVEYERLLKSAKENKKLYCLIQTICSSGIRVSELKYITCEAVKNKEAVINLKGKMRVVILPDGLCRLLAGYIRENNIKNGPVFLTRNNKPIDRTSIWKMLKSLCKKANVPKEKVFPHNLRHLFARTFYAVKKDIVRLADILGHSSINTTRIYTMETGKIHRMQIQKLGLVYL